MARRGEAWRGVAWRGVAWRGVACRGLARSGRTANQRTVVVRVVAERVGFAHGRARDDQDLSADATAARGCLVQQSHSVVVGVLRGVANGALQVLLKEVERSVIALEHTLVYLLEPDVSLSHLDVLEHVFELEHGRRVVRRRGGVGGGEEGSRPLARCVHL